MAVWMEGTKRGFNIRWATTTLSAHTGAAPIQHNKEINVSKMLLNVCLNLDFFHRMYKFKSESLTTFFLFSFPLFPMFFFKQRDVSCPGSEKKLQKGPVTQRNVHDYLFHAPRGRGLAAAVNPRRATHLSCVTVVHSNARSGARRFGYVPCWPPCGRRRAVARRDRWVL